MIKVRISDESVNCYGTRILTDGIDLSQYERNPVLLYMHERGQVVGVVKNLEKKDGELLGELEFDKASPLSVQLEKQYQFGSLRMVSANFQVLETSDDNELAVQGQRAETITRCQLFEVSAVDIGGNQNALRLCDREGRNISLAGHVGTECLLPLLSDKENQKPTKQNKEMETAKIALALGMEATATEAEVLERVKEERLKLAQVDKLKGENERLREQQQAMALAAVTHEVEQAIKEKRISATMRDHFVKLGNAMGAEALRTTLAAMQPQAGICQQLRHADKPQGDADYQQYQKLSAVPAAMMDDLRDNHHDDYARLYKAEYGIELC